MKVSRRDFLRYSAMSAAAVAAGLASPQILPAARAGIRTLEVGPCRYCAVGCAMVAECEVDKDGYATKVLALKGDIRSLVNKGVLCTKGFYLHKAIAYKDRPKGALIRKEWINPSTGKPDLKNCPRVWNGTTTKDPRGLQPSEKDLKENFVMVPWKDAINFCADAIAKTIKENGKHSVGFYGSGQLGITETHIMNKTMKGGGGIANNAVEGQPRMCMASAVGGYLHAVGSDEPFGSVEDIDDANTFFIIGSNTAEAHPVLFNRVAQKKFRDPDGTKVILADPRKTRSGTVADLWLPFASGRDLLLLNSIMYVIAAELDGAKWDVTKGTVNAKWKYLDRKFIERHVNFGYIPKVTKKWIHTEYGGTRKAAWDVAYTGAKGMKFSKVHPTCKKLYKSKDEVVNDLYKGFAIWLEFMSEHNPDKIADAIFEGESPLLYDRTTRRWTKISGPQAIRIAAKWFAEGITTSIWTMGVNQKTQGAWTNAAIHTLHFITGQAFKPGRHSFSFTGQPSACGTVRSPGALCHALMYDRVVAVGAHRKQLETIWKKRTKKYLEKKGLSSSAIGKELAKIKIHNKPGPHTIEMFRRFGAGQIKIMINSTVNSGQSLPYSWPYRQAMSGANKGEPWPLTITLEAFPNATTMCSDVVLGASSWYEKEFHYGQLERRYQACKQVIRPYGNTLPDGIIFAAIMRRLEEKGIVPKGHVSQFWPENLDTDNWLDNVEAFQERDNIRAFTTNVWNEMRELSRHTAHDLSGMTYEMLIDRNYGYRFPLPMEYHTDPKIKARIDKYQSRIRYAYPYDPLIEKHTEKYLKSLKAGNPVYAEWIEENLKADMNDTALHKAQGLPEGWWASAYNANVFIQGKYKGVDGKMRLSRDGRAIAWALPWYACEFDGKKWKKATTVMIIKKKFNPAKVAKNSAAPFDTIGKMKCKVPGDPNKSLDALKLIAMSPAEFSGLKHAYIKPDGSELVIIDTRKYNIGACTGRVLEHWHSGSMTTRVRELSRANPHAYVEINKVLADKMGIREGDSVIVESPRGKIELPAKVLDVAKATGGPRHDYVFIPWFDEFKLINMIMRDAFDPFSKQADYKMFAVRIYKGKTKGTQAEPGPIVI
jgi:nitrate reductase NapA